MVEIVLKRFISLQKAIEAMRKRPEAVVVGVQRPRIGIGRGGVWVEMHFETVLLALAVLASSGGLTTRGAIDVLWGEDLDGGPLGAANLVAHRKRDVRAALAALGFTIVKTPHVARWQAFDLRSMGLVELQRAPAQCKKLAS